MNLSDYYDLMLPAIENEMQSCLEAALGEGLNEFHFMMAYHLGWEGPGAGPKARGKRVRPMLVLLSTEAAGGKWKDALPAAAAVELVHNFSLIHDDIQDNSPLRRGRETVWKKWGIPQAINAGDSMFSLAHMALERLDNLVPLETALKASRILPEACLYLTQGQHLDISYENRNDLTVEDYWPMISGKTAALLAACTELGALIAGVDEQKQSNYQKFGEQVGLAFQVYDDLLGIWGDAEKTGKSNESDLLAGKKSLPVLYAIENSKEFAKRWAKGTIEPDEIPALVKILEEDGVYGYTKDKAVQLTNQALASLELVNPQEPASNGLMELADKLIHRET